MATCHGGSNQDYGRNFAQTPDSGYLYIGSTNSTDGDITFNHGVRDLWLTKLTKDGVLEWQLCLGGSLADYGEYVLPLSNNSYFVFGAAWSNDGDVVGGVNGKTDLWAFKLSPASTNTTTPVGQALPLQLSPTPTSGLLTLSAPRAGARLQVCVRDVLGQIAWQGTTDHEGQIDLSALPNGCYVIQAYADGQVWCGKTVKME